MKGLKALPITISKSIMNAADESVSEIKPPISKREILVLIMVAKGCTNKEIAKRLFISIETVRKHLKNSYKKLGAKNKIEALRKAGLMK